jgi:primosomal protein N' (replication factor Y)
MLDDLFAAPPAGFVRVALPVSVDRLFDYAVPRELASRAEPGSRVRVPFDSRRLTGVIVERIADPGEHRIRALESVVDLEPAIAPTLLRILVEEAERVLCPVGLALQVALPPDGPRPAPERLVLTARGRAALESGAASGVARKLLERLSKGGRVARSLEPEAREVVATLEGDGLVTRERRGEVRARPPRERVVHLAQGVGVEAALAGLSRAPKQAELLRAIAARAPVPVTDLVGHTPAAARALRELATRGLVRLEERPREVRVEVGLESSQAIPELTPEQHTALEPIRAAVRARRAEHFLLHGVTGSGKTEVYLRAVAEALETGRQALVAVPEITLTHQIVARLRGRFGDRLAVLHSGLARGERLAQWQRLRAGATPIAVGARSALFAPLENLGVIVVDEEHDPAYKNEEGFRYHARDIARRRADAAGCPLVLGSATPALETRHAAEQGDLVRLRLPRRIAGRPLPAVEIVDLVQERRLLPRGRKLLLSVALRRALRQTLEARAQAILFLNRRGFSTQIMCFECNAVERCKHCAIALVYHASEQRLRCHYCDYQVPPPELCSSCGAPDTALLGVGTERLEEDVRAQFPQARVARLDRDTATRPGAVARVLSDLATGRTDVLVGTQMVAKGHDFPGVRLVGIVNADQSLHFPDFRASERTFQLLTQVSGRAGRGRAPGRVILQTFHPEHYAIRPVVAHDYERFYREELRERRALAYPPFGRLARAVVSGPDEAATLAAAEQLAELTRSAAPGDVEILGPAPAVLARLRGRYRFQILLKAAVQAPLREAALALREATTKLPRDLRATLDLDPQSMA